MKVFSTLFLATLALAVVPLASASAATVGGGTAALTPNGGDEFSRLWAECLETRDANSDACNRAQELSGLSPDEFYAKLIRKLGALAEQPKPEPKHEPKPKPEPKHEPKPKPEPKHEPKPEAKRPDGWALMKACAATRDLESDACRHFIEATGLNADEVAHLADGLAAPHATADATTGAPPPDPRAPSPRAPRR